MKGGLVCAATDDFGSNQRMGLDYTELTVDTAGTVVPDIIAQGLSKASHSVKIER